MQGGKGGPSDPLKRLEIVGGEMSELKMTHQSLLAQYEVLKKEKEADEKRWESSYRYASLLIHISCVRADCGFVRVWSGKLRTNNGSRSLA